MKKRSLMKITVAAFAAVIACSQYFGRDEYNVNAETKEDEIELSNGDFEYDDTTNWEVNFGGTYSVTSDEYANNNTTNFLKFYNGTGEETEISLSYDFTVASEGNYKVSIDVEGWESSKSGVSLCVKDSQGETIVSTDEFVTTGWDNWDTIETAIFALDENESKLTVTVEGTVPAEYWGDFDNLKLYKISEVEVSEIEEEEENSTETITEVIVRETENDVDTTEETAVEETTIEETTEVEETVIEEDTVEVSEINVPDVTLLLGDNIVLPKTVTVNYSDDTSSTETVSWNEEMKAELELADAGTYSVNGSITVLGEIKNITCNVIIKSIGSQTNTSKELADSTDNKTEGKNTVDNKSDNKTTNSTTTSTTTDSKTTAESNSTSVASTSASDNNATDNQTSVDNTSDNSKQETLVHLGNGVGLTGDEHLENVDLSASFGEVEGFAQGFDTYYMQPSQESKLQNTSGVNFNLGTEYSGEVAYIFVKNMTTGEYEVNSTVVVNEMGNVGFFTDEYTDVMIMVEQ